MRASLCDVTDVRARLASRQWLRCDTPFPHVICRDVFTPAFHDALSRELRSLIDRGLSELPDPSRLSRNLPGYDAYAIGFNQRGTDAPTSLFTSAAWRDLICGLFDVEPTPYVFAGAHYHAPNSTSGFIHNDLNPVWFPRAAGAEMRTPDAARCAYKTGAGTLSDGEKIQVVRGVAVLYFLLNDGWQPGDGGELGLYESGIDPIDKPASRCPPINNSLVAFECTPRSYHAYLANHRLPRTSIIMWTHRSTDEAVARFGADKLERWAS